MKKLPIIAVIGGTGKAECVRNRKTIICILVSDNNKSIPHENIEKVFIPHFTTKAYGSGIGLSPASRIMHLHGGNINIQSVPGFRTEMTLML